jgi:transposase
MNEFVSMNRKIGELEKALHLLRAERAAIMLRMHREEGLSCDQIGTRFGMSRQSAHQIMKRYLPRGKAK